MKFTALLVLVFSLPSRANISVYDEHGLLPEPAMPAVCEHGDDCLRACERGEIDACLFAGAVLSDSWHLGPDELAPLYQHACRGGATAACARAGWLAMRGARESPDGNPPGLLDWFVGCESGDAPSCLWLAGRELPEPAMTAFRARLGDPLLRSHALLEGACERGEFRACEKWFSHQEDGYSAPDAPRFEHLLREGARLACLAGEPDACLTLSFRLGLDDMPDEASVDYFEELGEAEYRRRCEDRRDFTACARVAQRRGTVMDPVRGELARRREQFVAETANYWCEHGVGAGCRSLGQQVLSRHDNSTALALFRRGCEAGNELSCVNYADLELFLDDGDHAAAIAALEALPDCGGCWRLSEIYARGIRVPRDEARAERYLRLREFGVP